ncbi:MAG TPA: methyltransferase domain-containing protein [Polyangiaceae bacterium]
MLDTIHAGPIEFRCPLHHGALDCSDPKQWICTKHRETYPVLEGIPILLPRREDRDRIAETDWTKPNDAHQPLDFYNEAKYETSYARASLDEIRSALEPWVARTVADGPTLEIGSGRGALQGLGRPYIALDYSFTALRRNIAPRHPRVCGTAETLPFADNSIAFIFSIDALEHVPRPDLAFDEIDRVLMPGGGIYLYPAWHCVQYNCEGIPVRPYGDLNLRQKLVKLSLPVRTRPAVKALGTLPQRIIRRTQWALTGRKPISLRYTSLSADYEHFWISDSDACSRLDSHEGSLFFHSRGYHLSNPGSHTMTQLLMRHEPVIATKPR